VCDIDHHAQAVHLGDDLTAEAGQATMMLHCGVIEVA
jgi:hypothetical protein